MATLNIKDPLVRDMAHELAAVRGTTATDAVRQALKEALVGSKIGGGARAAALEKLQLRARSTQAAWLTDDDLYDAQGLPR